MTSSFSHLRFLPILLMGLYPLLGIAANPLVLVTHTDPLWVYPSAYSTSAIRVFQQLDERNIYTFKVVDETPFRFKVRIYHPNLNEDDAEIYAEEGWIDKINATVYLGLSEYEQGIGVLRLYEEPSSTSNFIDIAKNDYTFSQVGYVDSIHDEWYHVIFEYKGITYSGWIDSYCLNPYGC